MSKFTPGPWRVKHQKNGYCSIVYTEKSRLGGSRYYPEIASQPTFESPEAKQEGVRHLFLVNSSPAMTKPYNKNLEEMEANANLIAAAPELLEACKLARSALVARSGVDPTTKELDEAIAKAEGK